ncbi:uncharacterized protein LAESUDRAFT_814040 [Laetiporus sulphureus 93-53]|uniref:Uncharacterized protein n=1 Tax=Laetiporus sulphureus 93-53 TaxID=1314785 RepID=A0A165DED3_9APHY|nr:uncharacterized protein LAESUDRAFT_814040 [Laetiporus sulphureus 93-53]KZT04698.1 hypothetical protein LAESUDRAFT_814040 [Laetiporus sulphureus 93-53]
MLRNSLHRGVWGRRPKRPQCRFYVTGKIPDYHSKVNFFVFSVDREAAMRKMSLAMSVRCGHRSVLQALGDALPFQSNHIRTKPLLMQAVYLPMWLIHAEIEAKIWQPMAPDGEIQQQSVLCIQQAQRSCMPGIAHDPLSRISFSLQRSNWISFCIPASELHDQPLEEDIIYMEFQRSPLDIVDAVRSFSREQANMGKDTRFHPGTVKEIFFSANPVLMPLWLAQYETVLKQRITVILEAYHDNGRIIVVDTDKPAKPVLTEKKTSVLKLITKFLRRQLPYNRHVYSAEERTDFAHVETLSFVEPEYPPGRVMTEWINEHLSQGLLVNDTVLGRHGDGIPASDWEDPRIRPLVLEDTMRNDLYMEIDCYRRAVEAVLQARKPGYTSKMHGYVAIPNFSRVDNITPRMREITSMYRRVAASNRELREIVPTESLRARLKEAERWMTEWRPDWWEERESGVANPIGNPKSGRGSTARTPRS